MDEKTLLGVPAVEKERPAEGPRRFHVGRFRTPKGAHQLGVYFLDIGLKFLKELVLWHAVLEELMQVRGIVFAKLAERATPKPVRTLRRESDLLLLQGQVKGLWDMAKVFDPIHRSLKLAGMIEGRFTKTSTKRLFDNA